MRKIYFLLLTVLFAATSHAQTTLISPTGDGGFETGATFAANGWTVVNGATNQWFVGTVAVPSAGTNSAYVSDNVGGTTYNYLITGASVVHFYRDVTFPAGETNIVLTFKWKGQGESTWDWMVVWSCPTSTTPLVNTPTAGSSSWNNIPTSYAGATLHGTQPYNLQAAYQNVSICLPASFAGTTRRIVFTWSNDGSLGTNPPVSIDEISLVSSTPAAPAAQPTGLGLTAFSPSQINGSFTAATADGYLAVRYPTGAIPVNPTNGTTYTAGNSLGTGTVVQSSAGVTFSATGLAPSTTYDFYVYAYNNSVCAGPQYRTASPLFGTQTTLACGGPSGIIPVGPTGTYTSLTAALAAIAAGITGPVIFELQSTYVSGVETFPITFPNNGCAGPVNTITVRPETGAVGLTITSANATATIDFNGANYVTIDGRPGGVGVTSQLTISNTATGTAVDIRFINDAVNNTVTYCSLLGSTSTTFGVVSFSTGVLTGNDGNTISNNNISSAGANLPLNGFYSLGTSAAIDNSGNTINANNISDYFIATGSASIGIFLTATGNSTWTITNNRLFQTATRLYTSSQAGLCGISIQSGAGYTITGNTIGYANSGGTGTTNIVGNSIALAGFPGSYAVAGTANATRYIAISCAFTAGGAVSSIQNNTIAGFALYTSSGATTTNGIWCGINVTSGNVDIGTTTGNTIGSTTGNGSIYTACTTAGGAIVGIYTTSVNTVNIRNNTIGALDAMGTTATGNGGITGINSAGTLGNFDISGNIIGNSTDPNLRTGNLTTGGFLSNTGTTFGISTGTGTIRGILNSATGIITIGTPALPNTIRNASNNSSSTTAAFRGIENSGGGTGGFNISSNTISNFTSQSTNTTLGTGLLAGIGIYNSTITSGLAGSNIILNTITGLSLTNATATGTNVAGISIANYAVSILRNKICDIRNASTSVATLTPGTASGIFLRSATAGVLMNMANNMISLGNAQTTNTTFVGIWVQCGSTPNPIANIYYNTINIEGAVAAGAQPSFAVLRGSFVVTIALGNVVPVDIRNNILNNTRAGGTGGHYAIANLYGTTTVTGGTLASGWGVNASNYNVLNAANPAKVGNWTTDQTFTGWKTASAGDASSYSGIPVTFTGTCDLHLNMGLTPTVIESAGIAIAGITTDYDNQIRPGPAGSVNGGALAPDIGADEFDGVFLDIAGPVISYTNIANTLCLSNITLAATITDLSGVNTTAGTKPRLYFKKSGDANTYAGNTSSDNGWKYIEATNSSSPFSFTTNYSLLQAPVAGGDVIQYFVVAQDLAVTPNVGINSGIFAAPPTSVALTAAAFPLTGTINSYSILSGGIGIDVTIGAAETYTSLTNAGGLFETLNAGGLTANINATIMDASVTETGTIALNNINYGCGGPFTLTVKPNAGLAATLTGTNATALIKLNGADNVTFDGLNTGGASLSIINTNAAGLTVMWIASSSITDGATNNTIRNCTISGISSTGSVGCIIGGSGTTLGNPADAPNSNNTIQGNTLTTAQNGIYISGHIATLDQNWIINGNTIGSVVVANKMGFRGMSVQYVNNFTISNNTINGVVTATTSTSTGIATFNIATNGNIFNNKISDIKNTNATGFGTNGIGLQGSSTTSNINVYNNYISDVAGNGFGGNLIGDNGYGIILNSGGGYNIYYNTVVMNTNQVTATGLPAALNVATGVATAGSLNIRNNIFVNTQTVGTNRYCVFSGAAASVYADINYNDYYFTGPNLGNIGGTVRLDLTAWRTGTGKDLQSVSVQPVFVSGTDFHLSNAAGANWCLNGAGQTIATYTTDYDGNTRGTPPDIGADEFVAVGTGDIATPASQTVCSGTAITTIVLSGGAASYSWTRDNTVSATGIASSGTGNISGTLTNTTTSPVTVTFTITALNVDGCTSPAATFTATVTVNPDNTITLTSAVGTDAQTVCLNSPITNITYATTGATGANITGLPSGVTGNWLADVVTISGSPSVAGVFNYLVTLTGGCGTITANGTISVNDVTGGTVATDQTICSGGDPATFTETVASTGSGTLTYQWQSSTTNCTTGFTDITGETGTTYDVPSGLSVTTYYRRVTTSTFNSVACTANSNCITVFVNDVTGGTVAADQTICSGGDPATFTETGASTGSGTLTYQWQSSTTDCTTGFADIAGATSATFDAPSGLTVTTYYRRVTISTLNSVACTANSNCVTVTVNPLPFISGEVSEPSTCVSADGSIDLNVFGSQGPFTFFWTTVGGSGIVQGAEDQFTLTVGQYTVLVTDQTTGCQQTAVFNLTGPGNCGICPTIGSVTTSPTPAACAGATVTLTASGLTSMGITYGITFKYSLVALPDPYTGGTVIGTVANGSLGGGGTTATLNTSFPVSGNYIIYAILDPTPIDPLCRPSASVSLTVNPIPDAVATPSSQTVCSGNPITTIVLSGAVPGTTFDWTRDNTVTVTGIAASGSGDISGTMTNTTNAPITVTFTITPTANGCVGAPITATVTVNPTPSVSPVPPNQTVCNGAPTAPVTFNGPVAGTTFTWTNNTPSIGLAASGTGNIASFTATNPGTVPVVATVTVTPSTTGSGACTPSAPQTFTNSTPVAIPTGPAVVTSTINVSGAPIYLYDLNVIANITHTFAADLDITIQSPAGTVVTLTTDNGAGNDDVFNGTIWDDDANPAGQVPYTTNNGITTDHAYVNLTLASPLTPEEALGAFIGENPNGVWTITISDDLAGDGGSLNSWSLAVRGLTTAPTLTGSAFTQSTPVAIPTGPAVVTSTLVVSGAGTLLHDVNLTTFLTHTFAADLDITLQSPAGTIVTLTTDNGAGNDNVFNGTVWNDNANPGGQVPYTTNNGLATDHAYVNLVTATPLVPEEPLAAFIGENPNGTWTITISDDLAGDGGSLDSWTLNLQTATCSGPVCTGPPVTFTYTVNPTPNAVATPSSQTVCSATPITTIALSGAVAGTTFNWTRDNTVAVTGIAASGSGNISGTLTNTTAAPVTVTFTITPTASGCAGTPITATVLVNPTPNAVATPASQTICSGATITTIVLSGSVTGTTFNWTRDNTVIVTGIAASGSGNISGSLTNTTNAPVTVTFTIIPIANGCPGAAITAAVLVNPTPNAVATPSSQTICNSTAITPIVLTGSVGGTTFNWTRDNTATVTGIAASGSGNISGTLTNSTNAPVTVTFTITPTANGCVGAAITATVLVNPTPTVNTVANQTVCNGTLTSPVVFTSPVAGTTYTWTNNTPSIGLGASGSGNIAAFTAVNATTVPVTATITVTPSVSVGGACSATAPQTFTNSTPVAIPTGPAVVTSTFNVSGAPNYLYDLNVIANITHTFAADLDITIQSPAGTVVTLTTDNGGGNDNVFAGTLWDDDANPAGQVPYTSNNGVTTDHLYANLTLASPLTPEEPLGAFIGENPNGVWTITISDDLGGDGGSLNSWSLVVRGLPAAPTLANSSFTQSTPVVIPTGPAVVTSTLVVSGAGTLLHDVNLTTFITHTFASDLDITLQSPGGTVVTLTTDNGGGNDNVFNGTIWDDDANPAGQVPYINNNGLATDHLYANLTLASPLAPEEPFAAFIGENPNGTWTLTISDDLGGDGGSLASWTLNLQTALCNTVCTGPPITFTITVNPTPTITCPVNIIVPSVVGACTAVVTYTPVVTGTPAPTFTYSFTGATTGSGNGNGSGSAFNVGVTTVTVTATNICGTVNCSFTITVTDSQLPVISGHPANTTVCAGTNATFNVVSTNALNYQWQSWNGTAWVNIAGANASTLTLNAVTFSMNTNSYRVVVIGLCTSVTSGFATLYVNALPTISLMASIPPILLPTQFLTLTAVVSPGGGTYQWQKLNGATWVNISGATGASLTGLTVNDIGSYRCVYTDLNGCVATSAAMVVSGQTSDNLYVYPNPNDGHFHVRFYNLVNEEVTVSVYNAIGQLIYRRMVITSPTPYTDIEVDLGGRNAAGTYVVVLNNASGRHVGAKKIIVYDR